MASDKDIEFTLIIDDTEDRDKPFCGCGRKAVNAICVGCNLHPYDCACFPVGYDHEWAKECERQTRIKRGH